MRLGEVSKRTALGRQAIRDFVKSGKLRANGNGPGRRILIDSIEEAKIPVQAELPLR